MLDRLRNYIVAVVAAALTLLSLVGVALSLTVWKPAQEVVATATAAHPLIMTREKVLPLLASEVTVSVKGGSADEVAVVFGSTADVRGWIGDSAFTEVVGLEAGYRELAAEDHAIDSIQSGDTGQSDSGQSGAAQSAASAPQQLQSLPQTPQSGDRGQSGDDPQSVETIADVLASNDMWVNTANGVGEASLRLTKVDGPVSILAVSSGDNPTLTLRWAVQSSNVALIVFAILSAFFGALALWAFVRQFLLERSRVARAAQLDAREQADHTDTTALSIEEIASRAPAGDEATDGMDEVDETTSEVTSANENLVGVEDSDAQETHAIEAEAQLLSSHDSSDATSDDTRGEAKTDSASTESAFAPVYQTEAARNTLTLHGLSPLTQNDETLPEGDHTDDTEAAEDRAADILADGSLPADSEKADIPEKTGATDVDGDDEQAHVEETKEAETHRAGRHAAPSQFEDTDPPETVPTDTGTIDLSAIRPGAILPSRRALREARERGESFLMVDGQEFDTGLIPRVTRLDAHDIDKLNDASEPASAAHVEEYIVDIPEQVETVVETQESSTGGWTSLMKSWARGRSSKGGKQ